TAHGCPAHRATPRSETLRSRGRGRKPEQTITAGEATGFFCAGRFNPAHERVLRKLGEEHSQGSLLFPDCCCTPVTPAGLFNCSAFCVLGIWGARRKHGM